mmetsp:Transcript_75982/g.211027  ORF Transcript_75982/g.211027 Transcript_75982/m.211027 type:complete len:284 (-) Transcript_75982:819-1670(-)
MLRRIRDAGRAARSRRCGCDSGSGTGCLSRRISRRRLRAKRGGHRRCTLWTAGGAPRLGRAQCLWHFRPGRSRPCRCGRAAETVRRLGAPSCNCRAFVGGRRVAEPLPIVAHGPHSNCCGVRGGARPHFRARSKRRGGLREAGVQALVFARSGPTSAKRGSVLWAESRGPSPPAASLADLRGGGAYGRRVPRCGSTPCRRGARASKRLWSTIARRTTTKANWPWGSWRTDAWQRSPATKPDRGCSWALRRGGRLPDGGRGPRAAFNALWGSFRADTRHLAPTR